MVDAQYSMFNTQRSFRSICGAERFVSRLMRCLALVIHQAGDEEEAVPAHLLLPGICTSGSAPSLTALSRSDKDGCKGTAGMVFRLCFGVLSSS